jgi:signal transduction histidine kinase
MVQSFKIQGYPGSYLFGVLLLITVTLRMIILYAGQSNLIAGLGAIAAFSLLYFLEPVVSLRLIWPWHVYLALQTVLVIGISSMRPFLDVSCALFIMLSVQATRSISHAAARTWNILFIILLVGTMILGAGLVDGLVIGMLMVAIGIFMVSFDGLYIQTQVDQAESQKLLHELRDAYQKLKEFASQAEELVAAKERSRLARELHDSVGQMIFSTTMIARSAQILQERDPARVPEQLDQLQDMTSNALIQLRSLIDQLHPPL